MGVNYYCSRQSQLARLPWLGSVSRSRGTIVDFEFVGWSTTMLATWCCATIPSAAVEAFFQNREEEERKHCAVLLSKHVQLYVFTHQRSRRLVDV